MALTRRMAPRLLSPTLWLFFLSTTAQTHGHLTPLHRKSSFSQHFWVLQITTFQVRLKVSTLSTQVGASSPCGILSSNVFSLAPPWIRWCFSRTGTTLPPYLISTAFQSVSNQVF